MANVAKIQIPGASTTTATKRGMLTIIIPVYNEEATIARVLQTVADLPLTKEVIVVNDCSTDGTAEMLAALESGWSPLSGELTVLHQEKNQGKGAALRKGFAAAKGDWVVIQDADLEYDPAEIPSLLVPLQAGEADVVFGSRYLQGSRPQQPLLNRYANGFLTWLSNRFTGLAVTDMETCYKVFSRKALQQLSLEQDRFGIEPEMTAKIAKQKLRVKELPIKYTARSFADGKKIGLRDLFQAVYCIVRYSFGK